jgi:hypothetical protein
MGLVSAFTFLETLAPKCHFDIYETTWECGCDNLTIARVVQDFLKADIEMPKAPEEAQNEEAAYKMLGKQYIYKIKKTHGSKS